MMNIAMEIDIFDETELLTSDQIKLIEEVLLQASKMEKLVKDSEVCVTIVTNERILELNRDYRGKDYATDVISFALTEQGEDELEIITDEETPIVLGDIVIALDKAKDQANEYGHSFERELAFLTVHGFLHLIGYDHESEEDEQTMFSKQEEILKAYGLER